MTTLRHATTNYKVIKPFLDAPAFNARSYFRIDNEPYIQLSFGITGYVDHKGRAIYYLAHYGKMNGDLMADPCVEFSIDREAGTIEPQSFRNDYMGIYDEVYIWRDGKTLYSQRLRTSIDEFLFQWLKNLKEQGFIEKIEKVER